MTEPIVATLPLTAVQLDVLTKLAGKGRILMDVDTTFLRRPNQREAARVLLSALRRTNALQKA